MKSQSPQIRKQIYPALKRLGFEKFDFVRHLEGDGNGLTQVEVGSRKHGDDGLYDFQLDIGFFSRALDDLMGWLRQWASVITAGGICQSVSGDITLKQACLT